MKHRISSGRLIFTNFRLNRVLSSCDFCFKKSAHVSTMFVKHSGNKGSSNGIEVWRQEDADVVSASISFFFSSCPQFSLQNFCPRFFPRFLFVCFFFGFFAAQKKVPQICFKNKSHVFVVNSIGFIIALRNYIFQKSRMETNTFDRRFKKKTRENGSRPNVND